MKNLVNKTEIPYNRNIAAVAIAKLLIPPTPYVRTFEQCETLEHIEKLNNECKRLIKLYYKEWYKYGTEFDRKEELFATIELANKCHRILQSGQFTPIQEDDEEEGQEAPKGEEMKQLNLFDSIERKGKDVKEVKRITREQAKDFILNKHYAQRWAPISYFYGLFVDSELVGVCTIGKPGSKNLIEGLLGVENKGVVYELNRLITLDGLEKNTLSYFVGQVLKDIKKQNMVLVSYADSNAGHCGYIYQATNWIYTGTTRKNSLDYYVPNGKHSRSYTEADREKYKDLRILRSVKHRYIYFACNKTLKKKYLKLLKYPIIKEYPKEKNQNYVLGEKIKRIIINKVTGESWRE